MTDTHINSNAGHKVVYPGTGQSIPTVGATLTSPDPDVSKRVDVSPGGLYSVTAPVGTGGVILGIGDVTNEADAIWICPEGGKIIIYVPDYQNRLYYTVQEADEDAYIIALNGEAPINATMQYTWDFVDRSVVQYVESIDDPGTLALTGVPTAGGADGIVITATYTSLSAPDSNVLARYFAAFPDQEIARIDYEPGVLLKFYGGVAINCDTGTLGGVLDVTEMDTVSTLAVRCFDNAFTSILGLADLTNLVVINCGDNQMTAIDDLTALTDLVGILIQDNSIPSFGDITNHTDVITLSCGNNSMTNSVINDIVDGLYAGWLTNPRTGTASIGGSNAAPSAAQITKITTMQNDATNPWTIIYTAP